MQPELLHTPFWGLLLLASFSLLCGGCARMPAPEGAGETLTPTETGATFAPTVTGEKFTPTVHAGQHPHSVKVQIADKSLISQTVQVNYLLYLPESYGQDPQQRWPLILFLHGRGERGQNLELLKKHPLPKILDGQADFPAIVVSPQLPLKKFWWSEMIDPLSVLLDQIQAEYSVDPRRIYLTGLSMGGFGAWEFALRYPTRFAAVVPIAGGYREGSRIVPENICDIKDVPMWVFHGSRDTTVPSFHSEILVEALQACGSNVRFTLYADAEHEDSFQRAYAEPELIPWLLAQTQE